MHPRKPAFLALAMVAALALLAPAAAAASGTPRHGGALYVTKECSAYTHLAGGYCTVTSSNLWAIPVGSKVVYEQALAGTVLETDITLDPQGPGAVAFGHVHLDLVAKAGTAVFTGGTGRLAGFTASVVVTPNVGVSSGWKWDGTFAFSHDNFYLDKTCGPSADPIGYQCTVNHSSFAPFPPGTEVHYAATSNPAVVRATIIVRGGSATGLCVWSTDVNAVCTFRNGTGIFGDFHLRAVVTANADASVWYWHGMVGFDTGD